MYMQNREDPIGSPAFRRRRCYHVSVIATAVFYRILVFFRNPSKFWLRYRVFSDFDPFWAPFVCNSRSPKSLKSVRVRVSFVLSPRRSQSRSKTVPPARPTSHVFLSFFVFSRTVSPFRTPFVPESRSLLLLKDVRVQFSLEIGSYASQSR